MLYFDNLEFDLGNISFGVTKMATVNVSNYGSLPAKLTPTNSSCSCTTGSAIPSTLQPNSNGKFIISLNSSKAGRGSSVKSITLSYEINRQPYSQLFRIKANVI